MTDELYQDLKKENKQLCEYKNQNDQLRVADENCIEMKD